MSCPMSSSAWNWSGCAPSGIGSRPCLRSQTGGKTSSPTELHLDLYQALPASERGAWLTSHGFVVHAMKKAITVIQGDVRGIAHLG